MKYQYFEGDLIFGKMVNHLVVRKHKTETPTAKWEEWEALCGYFSNNPVKLSGRSSDASVLENRPLCVRCAQMGKVK